MILKTALLTSVAPTLWMRLPRSWTSAERLPISLLSRTYSRACVLGPPSESPRSRLKSGWRSWICKHKGRRGRLPLAPFTITKGFKCVFEIYIYDAKLSGSIENSVLIVVENSIYLLLFIIEISLLSVNISLANLFTVNT